MSIESQPNSPEADQSLIREAVWVNVAIVITLFTSFYDMTLGFMMGLGVIGYFGTRSMSSPENLSLIHISEPTRPY